MITLVLGFQQSTEKHSIPHYVLNQSEVNQNQNQYYEFVARVFPHLAPARCICFEL